MTDFRWPGGGGWPVASCEDSPEALCEQLDGSIKRYTDGLGEAVGCLVDSRVGPVLFEQHLAPSQSSAEVLVDIGVPRDDALRALEELGLGPEKLNWTTGFESFDACIAHANAEYERVQADLLASASPGPRRS
jgi:hypothetical protein